MICGSNHPSVSRACQQYVCFVTCMDTQTVTASERGHPASKSYCTLAALHAHATNTVHPSCHQYAPTLLPPTTTHYSCAGSRLAPITLFDSHSHDYGDGQPSGATALAFKNHAQLLTFLAQRFPDVGTGITHTSYRPCDRCGGPRLRVQCWGISVSSLFCKPVQLSLFIQACCLCALPATDVYQPRNPQLQNTAHTYTCDVPLSSVCRHPTAATSSWTCTRSTCWSWAPRRTRDSPSPALQQPRQHQLQRQQQEHPTGSGSSRSRLGLGRR